MYGVAAGGGQAETVAIFTLDSSGNERVVYSFKGGSDGAFPAGSLTSFNGSLYGTTTATVLAHGFLEHHGRLLSGIYAFILQR